MSGSQVNDLNIVLLLLVECGFIIEDGKRATKKERPSIATKPVLLPPTLSVGEVVLGVHVLVVRVAVAHRLDQCHGTDDREADNSHLLDGLAGDSVTQGAVHGLVGGDGLDDGRVLHCASSWLSSVGVHYRTCKNCELYMQKGKNP